MESKKYLEGGNAFLTISGRLKKVFLNRYRILWRINLYAPPVTLNSERVYSFAKLQKGQLMFQSIVDRLYKNDLRHGILQCSVEKFTSCAERSYRKKCV